MRLGTALLCLLVLELAIRGAAQRLDQALLHQYRLPDVVLPPVREFAAATARMKEREPDRRYVGLGGPSSVWGYGMPTHRALAVRAQADADQRSLRLRVLNLAMPRNRYADDRMVAGYFAGHVDLVLIPFSGFIAYSLDSQACPSHLPVVEWSGELPDPFPLPAPCAQPPRHHANAALERAIASLWHSYDARAVLRHLIFRSQQDFGRGVVNLVFRGNAAAEQIGGADAGSRFLARPAAAALRDPGLLVDGARMLPEVERLCQVYADGGTRVAFFHLPSAVQTGDEPRETRQLAILEAVIRAVAARHPTCSLVELPLATPLDAVRDYLDNVHPGSAGLDKLARGLVDAALPLLAPAAGAPR